MAILNLQDFSFTCHTKSYVPYYVIHRHKIWFIDGGVYLQYLIICVSGLKHCVNLDLEGRLGGLILSLLQGSVMKLTV